MTVAVIDGMGGGIGTELVTQLRKEFSNSITIIALGINAVATDRMMQAKANKGASGENAIKFSINNADYIIGPLGIVIPNGLMGEVTPQLAEIVMNSRGKKILIPINHPDLMLIGVIYEPLSKMISYSIEEFKKNIV